MEDLNELAQDLEECKVTEVQDKNDSTQQSDDKISKNQLKKQLKQQKKQDSIQKSQKHENPSKQPKNQSERKKPADQIKELSFIEIGKNGSLITIWHRPTPVHINLLKSSLDLTLIVSLQGEREHVSEVEKSCNQNDVKWFNIPLEGANETLLSSMATRKMIQQRLIQLKELFLISKEKALIHCAAGIHRTGTITYSLLRLFDHTHESAMNQLNLMREITFQQVGLHRIDIAERYFVKPILENKLNTTDETNPVAQVQQQQFEQDKQIHESQNQIEELL